MEECQYQQVNVESEDKVFVWKYLLRQVLVSSGFWSSYFTQGLIFGAPTVIIPQLRREANSTDAVSEEMVSWLSSVHGFAALPWVIILPLLSAWIGRKYTFLFVSTIAFSSYIFFYCSTTVTQILISEICLGILTATQITVSIISITEYTSPRYRGIFLALKSASFNWGMWVANAFGTFFHWKTIAVLGIVCSLYNSVITLFWCESPYWLASKHRFEACAKSHRWIKGKDSEAEKELDVLIKTYEDYRQINEAKNIGKSTNCIIEAYKTAIQKAFYKPLLLCLLILSLFNFTGKLVVSIYAIDIIKKITSTESTAYMGMLLLDGVTVTGMYIGCGLSKIINRRTLLLGGSSFGATFLFILSLYLYLISLSVIEENKYASLALLTMFSLSVSVGPIILTTSIYGELVPIRFRTIDMLIVGLFNATLIFGSLKTGPLVFRYFKLHGAFIFYGILTTIVTIVLYIYLPETKDKTLQEIEKCLIGEPKCSEAETTLMNKISN